MFPYGIMNQGAEVGTKREYGGCTHYSSEQLRANFALEQRQEAQSLRQHEPPTAMLHCVSSTEPLVMNITPGDAEIPSLQVVTPIGHVNESGCLESGAFVGTLASNAASELTAVHGEEPHHPGDTNALLID